MKITPEPLTEPGHLTTAPASRLGRLTFEMGSAHENCAKGTYPAKPGGTAHESLSPGRLESPRSENKPGEGTNTRESV